MDHHPNHQTMLFVESYPPLAKDTSTSMQTVIEDYLRPMAHNTRALAIIAVVPRKLQVQINRALLLQQWPSIE
jgi:hypothetical protein